MHACTLRARAIVQPPDIGIQLNQLIPSILCKNRLCQLKKRIPITGGCARARTRNESPRSHPDFELLGPIVSFSVRKLRPFEQKVPEKN